MKYFYHLDKSEPFTDQEYFSLRQFMVKGDVPESMFSEVDFFWNKVMGKEVNGCFSIFHPNHIFLTMSFRGDMLRLAAVAAHELTHRADFFKHPLLYIICCVPIIREFTIERRALRIQEMVNRKLEIEEGWWL